MKNRLLSLLLVVSSLGLTAQTDMFPEYTPESYNIAMNYNADSIYMFNKHKPNDICNTYMYYQIYGVKPIVGHRWIKTTDGTQNADEVNNPAALLCRLLKAYASRNLDEVKSLYRESDAAIIDNIMSVDSVSQRWFDVISLINKFDLIMSYDVDEYTQLVVELYHDNELLTQSLFTCINENDGWKMASIVDSTSLTANLSMYLNFYHPTTLLADDDMDSDGIPNLEDNCACVSNADQKDKDDDGVGDNCDNCPDLSNPYQEDFDNDGIGDECDNCLAYNPEQLDTDQDGIGDDCDVCPYDFDPDQEIVRDAEGNWIGLACNPDIDGDGIPNEEDDDMDGDGWHNEMDNCPRRYNPDQTDSDGDGVGDVCDNCKLKYNPDQADTNHNGIGDVCDEDIDGDGIPNEYDNCPYHYNPEQEDEDCNGIGDACQDF